MKYLNNQQGYTLVAVILIIAVVGLMTPPLINSVTNTSKQNQITEQSVQLKNLTDMGKLYFREDVKKVTVSSTSLITNMNADEVKEELSSIDKAVEISLTPQNGNLKFKVGYEDVTMEGDQVVITYISKGIANGATLKEKEVIRLLYVNATLPEPEDEETPDPPGTPGTDPNPDDDSDSDDTGSQPGTDAPVFNDDDEKGNFIHSCRRRVGNGNISGKNIPYDFQGNIICDLVVSGGKVIINETINIGGNSILNVRSSDSISSVVFQGPVNVVSRFSELNVINISDVQFTNTVEVGGNASLSITGVKRIEGKKVFLIDPIGKGAKHNISVKYR
ncbi:MULTISPECIES: type II secretion system protein [Bacillus]|uniref:type II secretion system protein n=1 Tax=Bacillus TaxID=1386 RepID=UPI000BB6C0A8|nr:MULTISPECIES: hypothetical protein [Bacillus]